MNKKKLITGMMALAAAVAATSAQASVTLDGATFTITQAANGVGTNPNVAGGTYDIWDITVTGLTGAAATPGSNGVGIQTFGGTWTVSGTGSASNTLLTPGNSSAGIQNNLKSNNYAAGTTITSAASPSGLAAADADQGHYTGATWMNLDSLSGFTRSGQTTLTTATAKSAWSTTMTGDYLVSATGAPYIGPTNFSGSPGSTNGDGIPDNPFLAEVIVTHGTIWTLTGKYGDAHGVTHSGLVLTNTPTGPTGPSVSLTASATGSTEGTINLTRNGANQYLGGVSDGTNATDGNYQINNLVSADGGPVPVLIDFTAAASSSDIDAFVAAIGGTAHKLTSTPGWAAGFPNAGNFDVEVDFANNPGSPAFFNFAGLAGVGGGTLSVDRAAAIPEPGTLGLAGLGAVLAAARRKRRA